MNVLALILLLSCSLVERAAAGEVEVAEFRKNYPEAVGRLVDHAARVSGSCRIDTVGFRTKKTTTELAEFAADQGYAKVTFRSPSDKGNGSRNVLCVGLGMAYRLHGKLSDPKTPPSVLGIGRDAIDEASFRQEFGRFLKGSHSLGGPYLEGFTASPGFQVVSVERVNENGRDLRRVVFRAEHGPSVSASGWMRLDPALSWALVDWDLESTMPKGTIHRSGSVEYGPPIDGLALPKRIRVNESNGDKTTCEFSDLSRPSVPLSEFMMSRYGLPDLVGPTRFGLDRLWAPTLVAVGVAVVLFAARRFVRKPTGMEGLNAS